MPFGMMLNGVHGLICNLGLLGFSSALLMMYYKTNFFRNTMIVSIMIVFNLFMHFLLWLHNTALASVQAPMALKASFDHLYLTTLIVTFFIVLIPLIWPPIQKTTFIRSLLTHPIRMLWILLITFILSFAQPILTGQNLDDTAAYAHGLIDGVLFSACFFSLIHYCLAPAARALHELVKSIAEAAKPIMACFVGIITLLLLFSGLYWAIYSLYPDQFAAPSFERTPTAIDFIFLSTNVMCLLGNNTFHAQGEIARLLVMIQALSAVFWISIMISSAVSKNKPKPKD